MDFRTNVDNQVYGVRATALIVRDGKIYLCNSASEGIYYAIGGAVEVGETTEEAVQREVREEIGCEVRVDKLAFVVENAFCQSGVNFHNIEFHYLVTPVTEPNTTMVEDNEKRACEWVAIDELDRIDLKPAFLKTALKDWNNNLTHIVNLEKH
ncbi:NUDIX hydrolase [Streptococcus caprae]|uniref:NUDIX hydrolase n=1 Tax=Streptococcus caprae TaxID=1640501 RepID=A0ABV8CVF0_9STRE